MKLLKDRPCHKLPFNRSKLTCKILFLTPWQTYCCNLLPHKLRAWCPFIENIWWYKIGLKESQKKAGDLWLFSSGFFLGGDKNVHSLQLPVLAWMSLPSGGGSDNQKTTYPDVIFSSLSMTNSGLCFRSVSQLWILYRFYTGLDVLVERTTYKLVFKCWVVYKGKGGYWYAGWKVHLLKAVLL